MASTDELGERLEALEARVRELEDEREVREVISRYGYLADGRSDDAWVDLWTDDGTYDLTAVMDFGDDEVASETMARGREALQALITDPAGHHRPGFYGRSMHTGGDTVQVRIEGDRAVAHSYSKVFQDNDGAVHLVSAASNQWVLNRVDGTWLLHLRRRRQLGTEGFIENLPPVGG